MGFGCGAVVRLRDWLVRQIAAGEDEDLWMKRTIVSIFMTIAPAFAVFIMIETTSNIFGTVADCAVVMSCVTTYAGWLISPTTRMEVFLVYAVLIAICMEDYSALSRGDRYWSACVIVVDGALVFKVGTEWTKGVVGVVCVYLTLASVDRAYSRFNADVSSLRPWICDCADPPCRQPVDLAAIDVAVSCFIFLTDFVLTRGFASGMQHQMDLVQRSIEVTQSIAQLLALYEVEEGRALLEGEQGELLPPVLKTALHTLLDNLDEYKPYLPDQLLYREAGVDSTSMAEPPGLGQSGAKVAMCFTDIQSSTELWEAYPQAMHAALIKHNDVMRTTAKANAGYEVKVIGDAFMLAFKSAEDACRFGLQAQVALAEAKWPSDLLQHPLCKPAAGESGDMVWNGPRVRIGINYGEVRVEKNPVTGRCDYFGSTVNTAARVEACLQRGGLTGATAAVLRELGADALPHLGDHTTLPLGEKELKGVREPVEVTVLLRPQLAERKHVLTAPAPVHVPAHRGSARPSVLSMGSACTTLSASIGQQPTAAPAPAERAPAASARGWRPRRTATCGAFRARPVTDLPDLGNSVLELLASVEAAADATQGVMVGALSAQCVVVWNGPRACRDHYDQCLRAADIVREEAAEVAFGGCSGDLLHGNVSGARRKHSAVAGGCVGLAATLAEAAEQCGGRMLAATTFGMYCSTQKRTRRHAEWRVDASGGWLTVWALTEAPRESDDHWLPAAPDSTDGVCELHDADDAGAGQPTKTVVLGAGVELVSSVQ